MANLDLFLIAGAATSLVVTAAYAYAGALVRRRRVPPAYALAQTAFAAWWFGIALVEVVHTAGRTLLLATGVEDLPLHVSLTVLASFALFVAMWGLVAHLLFALWGRRIVFLVVGAFYLVYGFAFLETILTLEPVGVEAAGWHARLVYARDLSSAMRSAIALGYLAPPILAALAYLGLLTRLPRGPERSRVGSVGVAVLLWCGALVLDFAIEPGAPLWLVLAAPLMGVGAAASVCVGYGPRGGRPGPAGR